MRSRQNKLDAYSCTDSSIRRGDTDALIDNVFIRDFTSFASLSHPLSLFFLCNHGYQYVWLNQEVGCNNAFLKSLKLRLVDCRLQEWNSHLESSDRFEFYRTFKSCCSLEMYLSIPVNKFILKYLIKFRLGISCLAVHSNRYKNVHRNHLLCRLCGLAIEDEIHLILCCPALSDLRAVYIPDKYSKYPCGFKLALLLSGKNENLLCNLALFVYRALKRIEETSLVY